MLNWFKKSPKEPNPFQAKSPDKFMFPSQSNESVLSKKNGDDFLNLGKFLDAVYCYQQAISLNPNYVEAHINLGNALRELGKFAEAEQSLKTAISFQPPLAYAHYNLASLQMDQSRFEDAIINLNKALQIMPNQEVFYRDLCFSHFQTGEYQKSIEIAKTGLLKFSQSADLNFYLGNLYLHEDQFDLSISAYNKAIQLKPDLAAAYSNLGKCYYAQGNLENALDSFNKAVKYNPHHIESLCDQGTMLIALNMPDKAMHSYDQAISINPNHADTWCFRGNALSLLNRENEALDSYDKAISINSNHVMAWTNRGVSLSALARYNDAHICYQKALLIDPSYAEAHFNKSIHDLLMGDFNTGLAEYEWRFNTINSKKHKRHFVQPRWTGEQNLTGKTILLYSEQGLGDTLQFSRYIEDIEKLGPKVILEIPMPLVSLFSTCPKITQIIPRGESLPEFDYQCPLMSLPLAFNSTIDTIPPVTPCIKSTPKLVEKYQAKLRGISSPRVGFVWSGTDLGKNDWRRSIPLKKLSILSTANNIPLISLQKEIRPEDQVTLEESSQILHFGNELADFSETAGLMQCMDIVITIDSSVAHLAGAMNKPVWILLPYNPDWRWFLERSDSPWYTSARLFRQSTPGDWDSVIQSVNLALNEYLRKYDYV